MYKKLVTKPTSRLVRIHEVSVVACPCGFALSGQAALRGETRTRRRREMFVLKSYTSIFAVLRSIGVAW
jgi:cation transport ATPase